MKYNLIPTILMAFSLQVFAQTITDVDNNSYSTVTIGTQVWMKENLKTTRYNDGTYISKMEDSLIWKGLTTPAYCWFRNDSVKYKSDYGALYNWYTINTEKICPLGWHVPADSEWTTLANYLGGETIAGSMLKESGSTHWSILNTDATNSSGFTALPGGYRDGYDGNYGFQTIYGAWWSTTPFNETLQVVRVLLGDETSLSKEYNGKNNGHYVRCIKDAETTGITTFQSDDIVIYPNPAAERIFINYRYGNEVYMVISDLQGKQVINQQLGSEYIDISHLEKGIYIVKISENEKTAVAKLIKE